MNGQEPSWTQILALAGIDPTEAVALLGAVVFLAIMLILLLVASYIILVFILPYWLGRKVLGKLEKVSAPRDGSGRRVEPTATAKFMNGGDVNVLANYGTAKPARETLGSRVMRPTLFAKLGTVIVALLGVAVAFLTDFDMPDMMIWLRPLMAGLAIFAVSHILSYEVRYDREVMIAESVLMPRRERNWRDLTEIKDEGQGVYRMRFRTGGKLRMQKYLVGMRDFLTLAHQHIDANIARG